MTAFSVFLAVIFVTAIADNSPAIWLNASDAIVAVGLGMILFNLILKQRQNANYALALLLIFQVGYAFFRNVMFAPTLSLISEQMNPLYETYLKRLPNLKVTQSMVEWIQSFIITYQSAIWGSVQIAAVFFGFLLFNRFSELKYPVRLVRFPYIVVYLFIISLAMVLYAKTRIWGINLLVCVGMIYLIQGTGVLSFIWGDFFSRAKFMRTFLIIAIIINYPVLALIAITGVLDAWFDFRKLNKMEEIHESNTN